MSLNTTTQKKQTPPHRIQLQHLLLSSHSKTNRTLLPLLGARNALHLMLVIAMRRKRTVVVLLRSTVAFKAKNGIVLVLLPDRHRHMLIREEDGLLHGMLERRNDVAEAHDVIEHTQVAVPRLALLAGQWRNHQRTTQRVRNPRQRLERLMHIIYSSAPPIAPTHVNPFHCQVLPITAVLAIHVQHLHLHLLEAQLLSKATSHIVVVEHVVAVVYSSIHSSTHYPSGPSRTGTC